MPKASPIISNFTAGELSPRIKGRVDLEDYHQGCATLENMIVLRQGGLMRRPGTYFVAQVKDSTKATRLVSFEFSTTQAYIVEFGDQYIRFYKDLGQIQLSSAAYEISSPYLEADLFELMFCQSADTLYIAHQSYAPRKLSRTGHTAWTLTEITFLPPATSVQDWYPGADLTPGATTGNGVTFTASTAIFKTGDVNRMIVYGTARGVIVSVPASPTVTTTCTVDILDDFPDTDPIPDGSWLIRGSPTGSIDPDDNGPVWAICEITCTINSFRQTDVGKYIRLHDGLVRIYNVVSSTVVRTQILARLSAQGATNDWTLEEAAWSDTLGYPGSVTFFEQRLVFGGTPSYPQTIFASKVDDYENMTLTTLDDGGLQFTIAAREVNVTQWIEPTQALLIGTTGAEWRMGASSFNTPVTPTNISISRQTKYGVAQIQPMSIANATLFWQRAARKLREMFYNYDLDSYVAPDLTVLAEHVTEGQIIEMAWQQEPNAILWCVRGDGVLVGFTYDQEAGIRAWHRHITDGEIESVAVIPGTGDEYELWMVVKREIDGSDVRYIEYMMPFDWGSDQENCFFVDSGLTYDGTATTTITGLDHLEGKTVSILADGAILPDDVVESGSITLPVEASKVHVGLGFTSTAQVMPIEAGSATGTAQAKTKRISKVTVRLLNSLGFQIGADADNLDTCFFREPGMAMDAPVPLFTGDKDMDYPAGWETAAQPMIVQSQPLPLHVLALIIRTMTTND